ncbi:MAG TPA: mechanosensitive ion channel domain-containing protein [Candidatus Acidoferrales bacterium]|nr:mechanosensitive ion channel domain-containing protein [Candidatus Acidoferrales bacterium]
MRVDLSNAWKSGGHIVNSAVGLLPNLLLAVIAFVITVVVASVAKAFVRRMAQRRQRRLSLGILLGQMTQLAIVILGLLIALSIVAPSFHMVDLIKILGIGSVAIGFAFQNILQNFLAGVLLLIHEPFKIGDLISVTGMEGIVKDIQTRATIIQTAEGRHIVIPNAVLFTNPVAVAASAERDAAQRREDAPPQDRAESPAGHELKPA